MVDLDTVKRHLRLEADDNSENEQLTLLILSATDFVTRLTAIENDASAPKGFDLAVMLLIAHWYVNREAATEGNSKPIPYGFDMLVTSLRPASGLI